MKWSFGKEDIEEMLHLLYESPNSKDIRPSRVRAMFASRACRKSVMIGDSLTRGQMKRIVSQLSTLDQPWVRRLLRERFLFKKLTY